MPRDIPIANGRLLVNFDQRYNLRDLFFPHVGQENHTAGSISRFGVWVEGRFSWVDGDDWERQLLYAEETLVTNVTLESHALELRLICSDAVDSNRNLYLRRVRVHNLAGRPREVRLFFHLDCHLGGINIGDTAYYEPDRKALVHYKGRRYFLLSGMAGGESGLATYAAGKKDLPGLAGTWVDAQDGELSRDPISQGSVDSVGGLFLSIPPGGVESAWWWLAAGESFHAVAELDALVHERRPEVFLARTYHYWQLWVNKAPSDFADLPPRVVEHYKRSVLIMRTQIDERGAILAANDYDILQFGRDTYSYMWPRDGALVAYALVQAGHQSTSRRFFELCSELISSDGYLLHKYNPDGSLGSSWHPWTNPRGEPQLPIQEDETALVLWSLWEHYTHFRDLELLKRVYGHFIVPAARFLAGYRHTRTDLPAPSYDLWEERYGIWTFTTAAVWAGLQAAARFTQTFGDDDLTRRLSSAAREIRAAALTHLWDAGANRFLRGIRFEEDKEVRDDTVDSSLYALIQFGMLDPEDPRGVATLEAVEEQLWCHGPIGGVARYRDDYYHRVSNEVPGNPWIVCTLWLGDWIASLAQRRADLGQTRALMEWAVDRALPSGVMAEQVDPVTGEPLSVSPLTWSHAAFVNSVHHYARRYHELVEK